VALKITKAERTALAATIANIARHPLHPEGHSTICGSRH